VAIFVPPLVTSAEEVAEAIRDAAAAVDITVATVFMSARGVPDALRSCERRVPSFEFPEDAAGALAHAARLAAWRARPEGSPVAIPEADPDRAGEIIAAALARGAGWLEPDEAAALLGCYGIPLAETRLAATARAAARTAAALGFPVVLKAVAPGLLHKTEAGAVHLDLRSAAAVERAAREMAARIPAVEGFTVQPMLAGGVEMLVGLVQDPSFGPVLACGAGGTAVELMRDVSIALAPVTDLEAAAMIASLRSRPLLEGFRGSAPVDVAALEAVIHRVSALAERHPEIAELDLNPVLVLREGAAVVDFRVRVAPAVPPLPMGAR